MAILVKSKFHIVPEESADTRTDGGEFLALVSLLLIATIIALGGKVVGLW